MVGYGTEDIYSWGLMKLVMITNIFFLIYTFCWEQAGMESASSMCIASVSFQSFGLILLHMNAIFIYNMLEDHWSSFHVIIFAPVYSFTFTTSSFSFISSYIPFLKISYISFQTLMHTSGFWFADLKHSFCIGIFLEWVYFTEPTNLVIIFLWVKSKLFFF